MDVSREMHSGLATNADEVAAEFNSKATLMHSELAGSVTLPIFLFLYD